MFRNYLKIAFRNIIRHKVYSFINIFGLAIGMASAILIMLFVFDELSYDNYHKNSDKIYRLERKGNFQGKDYHVAVTAHPMGPTLVNDFAEIEKAVRIWPLELMVKDKFNTFNEERIFFIDKDAFQVFTFPLINGDAGSSLVEPNSIVLSRKMSQKYFGEENPLNKSLTLQWDNQTIDFKITGVMKNIPKNSHFHPDFFASYSSFDQLLGKENLNAWLSNSIYTYLKVKDNTNIAELGKKFPGFIDKYMGSDVRKFLGPDANINKLFQFHLRPVDEIYLYGKLPFDIEPGSDIQRVYIFSAIALLILIIASINFMNLSTARSARRAKEVGMRKVAGANRAFLIRQFLGESLLLSF
ncbi:MAG: ABC transporter permease, partial [Calditrichia bacterium]|nr:ABC transporter permease [Calditrichia bacterium]